MNVLVLSVHSPEIDRRIVHQINSLCRSGRKVTLVNTPARVRWELFDRQAEIVVDEIGVSNAAAGGASLVSRLGRKLPQPLRGIAHYAWHYLRATGRYFSAADPYYCKFFLSKSPERAYEAIHCHDLPTLPAAIAVKRRFAPAAKIIYDAHEFYPYQINDRSFQRLWSAVERKNIGKADHVITVNESLADKFVEFYGVARPAVIYNSYDSTTTTADMTRAEFFNYFDAPHEGFNVLFQGSLSIKRNLTELVKSFALLDPSYRLFVIGTGVLEDEMKNICQTKGIQNVYFGGWVEQERLMHFTPHADLGIIPYEALGGTLNAIYCTPNKLFEFIEARLPICASDLPELRKIVQENQIGRVYPMHDAREIADAIVDCRRLVEQGGISREHYGSVRDMFSWKKQEETLIEIYDRLGI